ncbi:hypothetical protein D3C75_1304140 [compost metagenome]
MHNGRRCPPPANCHRLVSAEGMISRAATCAGAIARPSKPMAIVGRPMPINPLTAPASRNVPRTNMLKGKPMVW